MVVAGKHWFLVDDKRTCAIFFGKFNDLLNEMIYQYNTTYTQYESKYPSIEMITRRFFYDDVYLEAVGSFCKSNDKNRVFWIPNAPAPLLITSKNIDDMVFMIAPRVIL